MRRRRAIAALTPWLVAGVTAGLAAGPAHAATPAPRQARAAASPAPPRGWPAPLP